LRITPSAIFPKIQKFEKFGTVTHFENSKIRDENSGQLPIFEMMMAVAGKFGTVTHFRNDDGRCRVIRSRDKGRFVPPGTAENNPAL
jgi:hypothetical protein